MTLTNAVCGFCHAGINADVPRICCAVGETIDRIGAERDELRTYAEKLEAAGIELLTAADAIVTATVCAANGDFSQASITRSGIADKLLDAARSRMRTALSIPSAGFRKPEHTASCASHDGRPCSCGEGDLPVRKQDAEWLHGCPLAPTDLTEKSTVALPYGRDCDCGAKSPLGVLTDTPEPDTEDRITRDRRDAERWRFCRSFCGAKEDPNWPEPESPEDADRIIDEAMAKAGDGGKYSAVPSQWNANPTPDRQGS
jgi:hypothetical protein